MKMKTKLLIILLLFISLTSNSQNEDYELTKKEIYNSLSNLSISLNTPKSNTSVFFVIGIIVENPELNSCADITSSKQLNKSILEVIESSNIFKEIYVEGENGIEGMKSGKLVELDKNAMNISLYYDSEKSIGSVYLGIKNKKQAQRFISKLIEKIEYKHCLKKLKRKI